MGGFGGLPCEIPNDPRGEQRCNQVVHQNSQSAVNALELLNRKRLCDIENSEGDEGDDPNPSGDVRSESQGPEDQGNAGDLVDDHLSGVFPPKDSFANTSAPDTEADHDQERTHRDGNRQSPESCKVEKSHHRSPGTRPGFDEARAEAAPDKKGGSFQGGQLGQKRGLEAR